MKSPSHALSAMVLSALAAAQGDTIHLTDGKVITGASVQSYTVRELKYSQNGSQLVPSDQVAHVELQKFKDAYKRSLANNDPDLMVTEARQQLAGKFTLLAQMGLIEAARRFYDGGNEAKGAGVLEELQKEMPDAGVIVDLYRIKFENYMGRGDATGYQNAKIIGGKLLNDATTNAWPAGFTIEGQFYVALAERSLGGDAQAFQGRMRDIANKAAGAMPSLAGRAFVQLAHSLREAKDAGQARKIYDEVLGRESSDENSRAGAYLGTGLLLMGEGDAANKEPYRQALLQFLRVRLETKHAWASLQAEALFHAMNAAEKWRGEDFGLVRARCRQVLIAEFADTEWAKQAR